MKRGTERTDVFSPGMRRAVLVVVLLSAVGVLTSLLYGARFAVPQAIETDSYGAGPLGHRVFAETLEALGYHVLQSRGDRFESVQSPLLFLEPKPEARVEGRRRELKTALADRADAGLPTLVVLPKWRFQVGLHATEPPVQRVPSVDVDAVYDAAFGEEAAAMPGPARLYVGEEDHGRHTFAGLLGTFEAEVPQLQTIQRIPPGAQVMLDSATGAVVLRDARGLWIVSDPDLLHSFNLHRADHALLWETLVRELGSDTVAIDEAFHGHGKVLSLGDALGRFPAVFLVVQALLLIFLLVMLGSRRFGPPLEEQDIGAGPREAIAVSASVLADGQPLPRLVSNYVIEVVQDLHRRLGLPDVSSLHARAERIDEVAKHRRIPPEARRLLDDAARIAPTLKNDAEAWKVARAAHAFRAKLLEPARAARSANTDPKPPANPTKTSPPAMQESA
ncbi:MAG: hypothetical protein H6722_29605 [Sandaracinus sp.]|nr:hypothetical protein [Sandaracinus sp.]